MSLAQRNQLKWLAKNKVSAQNFIPQKAQAGQIHKI